MERAKALETLLAVFNSFMVTGERLWMQDVSLRVEGCPEGCFPDLTGGAVATCHLQLTSRPVGRYPQGPVNVVRKVSLHR